MHITLYPEMDAKIKELLRIGDDPYCWYAAARIEQLEKELEQLKGNKVVPKSPALDPKHHSGLLEE